MSGERLLWFQLADRLGMTLQRCQQETTSREFLEWRAFLLEDISTPKPEHYYLAQVAAEVRRGVVKRPRDVRLNHFMLKFAAPKPQSQSAESQEARAAASKSMWLAAVGLVE